MRDERLLELARAIRDALSTFDVDQIEARLSPDYVEEYPQSRELIRGLDRLRRMLASHPTRPRPASPARLTIIGEDTVAVEELAYYGDEPWWVVALLRVAGDLVTGERAYYGPMLSPPAWRAQWVTRIPDDAPPTEGRDQRGVDRDTVQRYFTSLASGDLAALQRLRHPDFVHDMPQSGERFPSAEAYLAANENYPGGAPRLVPLELRGPQDQWVVGAAAAPLRVSGIGPHWVGEAQLVYPSGERWFQVRFMDFRDGKVVAERSYWAAPFEPPAWREGISERY